MFIYPFPDYGILIGTLYLLLLIAIYFERLRGSQLATDATRVEMVYAHILGIGIWLMIGISTNAGAQLYSTDWLAVISRIATYIVMIQAVLLVIWGVLLFSQMWRTK